MVDVYPGIANSEYSTGLVAEQIGYQHQTTFTRALKAYTGISPKGYRKVKGN